MTTGTPESADAVQGGHQDVEVVDPGVLVGQDRPDDAGAVAAAQDPDQETAVGARQPAVDVGVIQVDGIGVHPAQVGQRDAELVGELAVGDVADGIRAGGHGDAVALQGWLGAVQDQAAAVGADRAGAGDDVQGTGGLVGEQAGELV